WQRSTAGTYPTCTPYEGEGMATYQSWYASSGSNARLISPAITITSPTICTLKFWMMHDPGYSTSADQIQVQISPDGTTWTTIATFNRYAQTQAWTEHVVYLGTFNSNFYLGFNAVSAYGNNMYMDYVKVMAAAPAANDVGVDVIRAPGASHMVNTSMTPIALVKNYGTATQTNFPVVCSIVGSGGAVRYTNTKTVASIAAGDTVRVNFDAWTPTISENVTVAMRTNLTGDVNPGNDRKSRTTIIGTVLLNDFETSDGGYTPDPATGGWEWGTPTSGPNAAYSGIKLWATTLAGNYANSANWKLTTPRFTATTNNPVLKFWHWYNIETRWDGGNVKMSTNGTTFNLISPVGGYPDTARSQNVGIPQESCYTGSMTTWTEATFNLPVNTGQNFWIRWHFGSDPSVVYPGWYFDDVMLIGAVQGIEEQNPNQLIITTLNSVKPNPVVNGNARISFNIASPSKVSLKIYDASGRVVKTLVNNHLDKGSYTLTWNGRDEMNREVAEGIYFYTLETDNSSTTKKLILTR
ncbi:MAG: T9SS type A sorting domain-containing protein, partial [candidate division WOR-3 bacterium]